MTAQHVGVVTGRYGDCDECGEGLLKFANGALGSLAAGWVDVAHPVSPIVSGTEGHAYVANGQLFFQSSHVPGADGKTPWTDAARGLAACLRALPGRAGGKDVPLVAADEAAIRSAVMEALYEAARQQAWVAPK